MPICLRRPSLTNQTPFKTSTSHGPSIIRAQHYVLCNLLQVTILTVETAPSSMRRECIAGRSARLQNALAHDCLTCPWWAPRVKSNGCAARRAINTSFSAVDELNRRREAREESRRARYLPLMAWVNNSMAADVKPWFTFTLIQQSTEPPPF